MSRSDGQRAPGVTGVQWGAEDTMILQLQSNGDQDSLHTACVQLGTQSHSLLCTMDTKGDKTRFIPRCPFDTTTTKFILENNLQENRLFEAAGGEACFSFSQARTFDVGQREAVVI